ncbi:MAG: transposase [Polynucleobacter sp.]|nr:transposase [Polynucleobacter sp.]
MKLNMPRRTKKRLPKFPKQPLIAPTERNHIWSLDFMHDALYRGKPFRKNAFIERFNRTYRHEVLNAYLFDDLEQAREITEAWIKSYNEERPHRALGKLPPKSFRQQAENSLLPVSD